MGDQMIKAAFFDIDGTLVSFRTHEIPSSALEALRRLHAAGIKLFIATGRASSGLPEVILDLHRELPFDGFLTFNGQYCIDAAGKTYRDVPLNTEDVKTIVKQAEEGLYELQVMQLSQNFVNRRGPRVRLAEERVGGESIVRDLSHAFDEPVYQLCVYVAPGEEGVFADVCPHVTHARWCDYFCDVIPADGGKPAGIAATLEWLGIEPEECAAFGDGGNDVPMFGCVGTSVAMGNASDAVKAAASYVAPDIDADGILVACEELGLI